MLKDQVIPPALIHDYRPEVPVDPHKRPVLIVLHQESSSPGRLGLILQSRGFALDIRRPRFGDPLPDTMDGHSAAIIYGGPQSANDNDEYIRREIDWINVPMAEDRPFLGICLGAQMLAKTLGARVDFHDQGLVEVGYYPLQATTAGSDLMNWPEHVYQWHREGFDLPRGATLLARSESYENQAFQAAPKSFGIQFHSELTYAQIYRWTVKGAERMALPGAQQRAQHLQGRLLYDAAILAWLHRFLDHWLAAEG